nr:hypothetical protein [uncultured Flavobacterium sp.]
MKKLFFLFAILILTSSCYYLAAFASEIDPNINANPTDIVGTWKLDKESYNHLVKTEALDSIFLEIKADSSYTINTSLQIFKDKHQQKDSLDVRLIDNVKTHGIWNLLNTNFINEKTKREYKSCRIDLKDKKGNYISKINPYLTVYKLKDKEEYELWHYFEDPDSMIRLRFTKVNSSNN